MAIATIITRGYGSFGSIAEIITRGYDIGEAVVIVTPAERKASVLAEANTVTVIAENRTVTVDAENRTVTL
jgi:hypothetical protein